jgi:hypothetical protein
VRDACFAEQKSHQVYIIFIVVHGEDDAALRERSIGFHRESPLDRDQVVPTARATHFGNFRMKSIGDIRRRTGKPSS